MPGDEGAAPTPEPSRLDKATIVAHLREIAALLELQGGNKFKARAFARGARSLEASREPLSALIAERRLLALPGIGAALAHQIEELSATGTSELLASLKQGLPSGVLELSQVSGIGLHALRTLHQELGIGTVADLRKAAEEGRLREVKGFGAKKEEKILAAIARYEVTAPRLALADALRLAPELERELEDVPGVRSVTLAGSVRRFQELSTELDFVLEVAPTASPSEVASRVGRMPRAASVERSGDAGCRVRLADGSRVDVVAATSRELPTALAHALGAPAHVAKLAARARDRGLRLDASGLWSGSQPIPLRDEVELYERLGLRWIPPELREDHGEVELAAQGEGFEDLVTEPALKGIVHCHTTWSDGRQSIEEMARAAEERGAEFITITDHSGAAHYAGGLDVDRLRRQWDEIAAVQERVGITLLRGTESDILADGALDWPDEVLEGLDVVIASIHNRFRQDEAKMTERVLRAMRHPLFKIWGHPLGRLVTSRPPIPLRVEEVLDALAESRGAVEINGDPHRLDLEPHWVRAARARGIPLVLSVDAHSIRDLGNVRYAVGLARRAGVRREDVLNTRGASAFRAAVRPAG